MAVVAVIAPGAVTAGTNITLPDHYPDIDSIITCIHVTLSDATVAGTVTTPTATKVDSRTFTLGEDTTARSVVFLIYTTSTEYVKP